MNYFEHHIGDYAEATAHLSFVEDAAYTRLIRKYYSKEVPIPADLGKAQRLVAARTKEEKEAVAAVLQEFFELRDDGWHQAKCDEVIAAYKAGEPEREVKKTNEDTRLRNHRAERAKLFAVLNGAGQHAPWNIPIASLREMVGKLQPDDGKPATAAATKTATPATQPATAPATPATATQTPIPTTHKPTPSTQNRNRSISPPSGGCRRFEEFWTAWPKGDRKQDKVKCAERWRKERLDDLCDTILADIALKRGTAKWGDGFIEAPLVYLNGRRWEDGMEAAEQPQGAFI